MDPVLASPRPLYSGFRTQLNFAPFGETHRVNCTDITYWDGGRETWSGGTENAVGQTFRSLTRLLLQHLWLAIVSLMSLTSHMVGIM